VLVRVEAGRNKDINLRKRDSLNPENTYPLMHPVTLFLPIGRDISLLKRNLDYYTRMGIKKILLSVHLQEEWENGFLDSVNEIITDYPAQIAEIHTGAANVSKKRYETVIGKYCNSDDWVIVADLDEFYEYSRPLPEVLEYCVSNV